MRLFPALLTLGVLASSVAAAPGAGTFLVGLPMTADSAGSPAEFELLGGYGASRWQQGDKLPVSAGTRYTLWNLAGSAGSVQGTGKTSYGVPCEETYGVSVNPVPTRADWWVAVNATWNPRPRAVTVLPNSSAPYVAVVREFLQAKGLKTPKVSIDRVVRTDFDGDGKDEVIVAATNYKERNGMFPSSRGAAGDYGLLLVRKVVAGKVQTIVLGADVFLKATTDAEVEQGTMNLPDTYGLVNVLDLNGDGKMEIVMMGAFYEGYGISVMEWDGKGFKERLNSGCGA
jgi:hypothetical protein